MRVDGGTATAGVSPAVFAMPEGMSIRYDQPDAGMAEYITGYHVYAAHGPASGEQVNWFMPGTANVRIAIEAGPIRVRIGRHNFDPIPRAALFGPTTSAMEATTHGGVLVGFGISALGWARITDKPARAFCNRIAPAAELLGAERIGALQARLAAITYDGHVKAVLDELLAPLVSRPNPDEPLIRAFAALAVEDGDVDVTAAAERLGVPGHRLRRVGVRYFGMTPKLLLRRARFLRSFLRVFRTGDACDYSVIDPSYFDVSHFLRDAETFLGMTPRRFMALRTPFLDSSLRARAAVLGAATQALHDLTKPQPHRLEPHGTGSTDAIP